MTTKKIVIAGFAIFTIAFLAGCQAPAGEQVKTPEAGVGTQAVTMEQVVSQPVLSEADQAAYSGALQLRDASFCEKILDATFKEQCKTEVSDTVTLNEALTKTDDKICASLSTKDKQDSCKTQIEVIMIQQQSAAQTQQQLKSDTTLMEQIIKSGDNTGCKKLTIESLINQCEINILSTKATENRDISWCDKATESTSKRICENMYTGLQSKLSQS